MMDWIGIWRNYGAYDGQKTEEMIYKKNGNGKMKERNKGRKRKEKIGRLIKVEKWFF